METWDDFNIQVAWARLARSGRDDAMTEIVARMIAIGERGMWRIAHNPAETVREKEERTGRKHPFEPSPHSQWWKPAFSHKCKGKVKFW